MTRRTFFPRITGGISSSFLVGLLGGTGAGTAGAAVGIEASRPWSKTSFSQQGEDLVLDSICDQLKIPNPVYLDIGAADPTRLNNTFFFYRKGCRGVLVEPNPSRCGKLRACRPRDTVLNVGIGVDSRPDSEYFLIGGPGGEDLNTFSREQAEGYAARTGGRHTVEKVIRIPLVDINSVIQDHFGRAPDLVSVDTEGLDLAILTSLDFRRFRPSILCVETLVFGTSGMETGILELMASKNYTVRGGSFVNTIFVDDQLLEGKPLDR